MNPVPVETRVVYGAALAVGAGWLFGASRLDLAALAAGGALLALVSPPPPPLPPPPPPPSTRLPSLPSITTPPGADVNVSAHRDDSGKIVWTVDPWVGP